MDAVYDYSLLNRSLALAFVWLAIGLTGLLTRRHMLVMILSGGFLLHGVCLALASLGMFFGQPDGWHWEAAVLTAGGVNLVACLLLAVRCGLQARSLDISHWQGLRDPLLTGEDRPSDEWQAQGVEQGRPHD